MFACRSLMVETPIHAPGLIGPTAKPYATILILIMYFTFDISTPQLLDFKHRKKQKKELLSASLTYLRLSPHLS